MYSVLKMILKLVSFAILTYRGLTIKAINEQLYKKCYLKKINAIF